MRLPDAARLTLLAAIWCSSFMFIKLALEGFHPLQIVAGQLLLGAMAMLSFVLAARLRVPFEEWRSLAVMAIVAGVLPFTLITWSEEHITSGAAAILNSTAPLFTALFASALLAGERFELLPGSGSRSASPA
jgi:drug/metabolite transporter (DMT)-like permease